MTDPIVTQADLDRGRIVLPGVPTWGEPYQDQTSPNRQGNLTVSDLVIVPPFVVDQPCETCHGHKEVFASMDVDDPAKDRWFRCPDCLGRGVKLLTVQVPCGNCAPCHCNCNCYYCQPKHDAGIETCVFGHASFCDRRQSKSSLWLRRVPNCGKCTDGFVSVRLHVTAVTPIVDAGWSGEDYDRPGTDAIMVDLAEVFRFTIADDMTESIDLPGEPADLVDKFLIEGTVVEP